MNSLTSTTKIDIGVKIDLQTLLETRGLVQAGSGGGKSYTMRKMIESVCDTTNNTLQQIILDPESEFITLREKYPFALVAKGGDIELNLRYVEFLAHKILEENMSVIIDLYELKHYERKLFVDRFCDALINAPKTLWHSCLIYLDEAHKFCPEGSKAESMQAVIDLCTMGRKRGFGTVLATQRISKLHKDAAAECNNKFIGRQSLDIDLKRSGDELGFYSKEDMKQLRHLKPGEFYSFGPAVSNDIIKFKVSKAKTTHIAAGQRYKIANPPTPGAIKKIIAQLKDLPQEAEKQLQTIEDYQKEIRALNQQIQSGKNEKAEDAIRMLKDQIINADFAYKTLLQDFNGLYADYNSLYTLALEITKETEPLIRVCENFKAIKLPNKPVTNVPDNQKKLSKQTNIKVNDSTVFVPPIKREKQEYHNSNANVILPKAAKKLLTVLAQYQGQFVKRNRAAFIADLTPNTGHFNNMLGLLRRANFIEENGKEMKITTTGLQALGSYTPLPTDPKILIHYWQDKLGKSVGSMLGYLQDHYPYFRDRSSLASGCNLTIKTGHFNNCLGVLRKLELIEERKEGSEMVLRLSKELFNEHT